MLRVNNEKINWDEKLFEYRWTECNGLESKASIFNQKDC